MRTVYRSHQNDGGHWTEGVPRPTYARWVFRLVSPVEAFHCVKASWQCSADIFDRLARVIRIVSTTEGLKIIFRVPTCCSPMGARRKWEYRRSARVKCQATLCG